ncbi:MAG: hypothetical protein NZM07_03620, partial [Elioraea sp.]|nr:hypothetical protein [Elioraea sp.]
HVKRGFVKARKRLERLPLGAGEMRRKRRGGNAVAARREDERRTSVMPGVAFEGELTFGREPLHCVENPPVRPAERLRKRLDRQAAAPAYLPEQRLAALARPHFIRHI